MLFLHPVGFVSRLSPIAYTLSKYIYSKIHLRMNILYQYPT
nr:MAG TPA: hypothetical protein [Caudoviricetes sp.]